MPHSRLSADPPAGSFSWFASDRKRSSRAGPLRAALTVATIAVATALARVMVLGHASLGYLVGAGRAYSNPALLPPGVPVRGGTGYDGQFMYRLAHDPFNLHPQAFGIRLDNAFRVGRIGYPALAWLVSAGGQPTLLPAALMLVSVGALAALAALGASHANAYGLSAAWGVLVCWPGLLFSVDFDLSEPLEVLLVVAGLMALQRQRPGYAAALLSLAVLTRETALVSVVAVAFWRIPALLRHRRLQHVDLAWVIPPLIFAGWQLVCLALIGELPVRSDAGSNAQPPIVGIVRAWPRWLEIARLHPTETGLHALELTVFAFVVIGALISASRRPAGASSVASAKSDRRDRLDPLVVATAFGLAGACCFSTAVWSSRSDLRMFADTYALAALVLLARQPRRWALTIWAVAILALALAVACYRAQAV